MEILQTFSSLTNGKFTTHVSGLIRDFMTKNEGEFVFIEFRVGKKRTNKENRYYWGCVIKFQKEFYEDMWGVKFSDENVHDYNKNNFFCKEYPDEDTGEIIKMPQSTKVLSTIDFEEGLERIRQYYELNHNFRIPLPNEQLEKPN